MYTTQTYQRSIHQPATLVGFLGVMIFVLCPPLGAPVLIIAWAMQRKFTKKRRAIMTAQQRRAQLRAEREFILACKSLS